MKKLMLLLIAGMFLISFTSAAISNSGTFKQGECVELIQTCPDCTYNNISRVIYPDSTDALNNVVMQKDDTFYNYSFCDTSNLGTYTVNGYGDIGGIKDDWNYIFEVTQTGFTFGESESILIFALLAVLLILTFSSFYLVSINFTETPWLNFPLKIGGLLLGFVMTYSVLRIVRNLARDFIKPGYLEAPLNVLLKFMSIALPIIFLIAAGILVFDILLSLQRETVKVGKGG
ncbi:MAG TPA: hypothetical protein ENI22_00665 [Candidatus Pacearchaeota archaeon]|nr:hypothetical protein [Candidatus Pacearchaeota archaeon]